jgi:hypothetical protein
MVKPPWPLHRMVVRISTWFRLPEQVRGSISTPPSQHCLQKRDCYRVIVCQGMKEYEILSRGTAFCVHTGERHASRPYFVTCAHVVAPWKYPQHFQEPWLRFVNESHIKCIIELPQVSLCSGLYLDIVMKYLFCLEADVCSASITCRLQVGSGGTSWGSVAAPPIHFHDALDVCAFRLEDEVLSHVAPPLILHDDHDHGKQSVRPCYYTSAAANSLYEFWMSLSETD